LSQKLPGTDGPENWEVFMKAVANGSVVSWQPINLPGEYNFSDGKLQDSVVIKPQNLPPESPQFLGCVKWRKCL
jgi:hypothetical protein